jgi:archaellum component FlaC
MNPLLLDTALTLLPYAAGIIAWIFKDKILHLLNIELKKTQIKQEQKGVDTIYISNSEKLVQLYSKSMDDLNRRHSKTVGSIRTQYETDLEGLKEQFRKERIQDEVADAKREQRLVKSLKTEKELTTTVNDLKEQVMKLTKLVEKLGKQLSYYEEHTDLELPDNLK